jgi:ATP phosphoribosyltransferase regulatory subunit
VSKLKRYLPGGSQDYLVDECYNKRLVQDKLRELFFSSGYDEIETPVLEYIDVFTGVKASIEQEQMTKLFDPDGRILVLRPDITMPIARIAATKLKSSILPLRISYFGNVFRNQKAQSGRQSEIAQAGIELLGLAEPEAYAEVIALAVQSFINLGLNEFQIDIGQVEFFKGLIAQAEMGEEWEEEIRTLIDHKNMLELELLLKESKISNHLKNTIYDLPKLYGNGDMLKKAAKMSNNPKCDCAIENIREVYNILKDFGFERYLTFDLGMVQSFNFYTGIIFRGITSELGYPICGGGRYDRLVNEFGYDIPATGFATGIKRILMVLERQGSLCSSPKIDVLVAFEKNYRQEAYSLIDRLRSNGHRTEAFIPSKQDCDYISYAKYKKIPKVIIVDNNGSHEITTEEVQA